MDRPLTNEELQSHYEKLHRQGSAAWFSDGAEERQAIIETGRPWDDLRVLEIGCGEGELAVRMVHCGAVVTGLDYSVEAIRKAKERESMHVRKYNTRWVVGTYREAVGLHDRIVMQGVLEHLNNPWQELEWMLANLLTPTGEIVTSSPCFCNPRGIVWMTLATLFDAPMSLTDLHFLHPWEFEEFAGQHGLKITTEFCDWDWGTGQACVRDLSQRLPKVFPGMDPAKITRLIDWLSDAMDVVDGVGATAVYHLRRK